MYVWRDSARGGPLEDELRRFDSIEGIDYCFEGWDLAAREEFKIILSEKTEVLSPERLVIRRDLFRRLSDEAIEVVDVVINTPAELLELVRKKESHVTLTMRDIFFYLGERGLTSYRLNKAFAEIKQLVRDFL